VLNISWGAVNDPTHPEYDAAGNQMIHDAVQYAAAQGCVMVCSAGNFGGASQGEWTYTGGLDVPAAFPETISVGSVNDLDERSEFSSWAASGEQLDVVAPGELISGAAVWSAADAASYAFSGEALVTPGDADWDSNQGTSFAAPLVSGLAALILSRHPDYTPENVRWCLRLGALDLGDPGYDPYYGHGLVQGDLDALPPPTAVLISQPRLEAQGGGHAVLWESWLGPMLAGYHIRPVGRDGALGPRLTRTLIPAADQTPARHRLRLHTPLVPGQEYVLEAVKLDGSVWRQRLTVRGAAPTR
jgi:subtilisin family serine protease